MSKTISIEKKKKKIDFELLRKLEKNYDDAVEDMESKEEILIKSVHREYLNAENKGDFFQELEKSERWYYLKFEVHNLQLSRPIHSEGMRESHQKRKVENILNDLEEMEKQAESRPVVEIDETLLEDTEYIDPREQEKDWIHRTRVELQSEEPRTIVADSKFGKYQGTKGMISKIHDLQVSDFNVGDKYRPILLSKLDNAIEYLNELRRKLNEKKN